MSGTADGWRDPARDHALAFTLKWAERTGKDPHGTEAEEVYEQAFLDACDAMDASR